MRKITLLLMLPMLLLCQSAWGQMDINGVLYEKNSSDNTVSVIIQNVNTISGELTIPATFRSGGRTYTVTRVEENAFAGCEDLLTITLPNTVTFVGAEAFSGCKGLTHAELGTGVTTLGESVFAGCTSLKHIVVPEGVTAIADFSFADCTVLESVSLPKGVKTIGESVFNFCEALTGIEMPDSLVSLGKSAFAFCSGLEKITLPNALTAIGENAFRGCTALKSVNIPTTVTSIGTEAFYNCSALEAVYLAWTDSRGLSNCACGDDVFKGIPSTTKLYMPEVLGASSISGRVPWNSFLASHVQTYDPQLLYKIDGICYYIDISNFTAEIAHEDASLEGEVTVPAYIEASGFKYMVKSVADAAFILCSNLITLSLPETVTSIGQKAFMGLENLETVTIPNSVTSIGASCFSGCTGLQSIILPDLTAIAPSTFKGCSSLSQITIPNSVTSIGDEAFAGCANMQIVRVAWLDPAECACGTDVLKGINSEAILCMPVGTQELYKATAPWNQLTTVSEYELQATVDGFHYIIYPATHTAKVWEHTPNEATGDIVIPETITYKGTAFTVTGIGNSAFSGCSGITSISLPNTLQTIEILAFNSCTGIQRIDIPNSVESIEDNAFFGCTKLSFITVHWLDPAECACGDNLFMGIPMTSILYVPEGTEALYADASPWKDIMAVMTVPCEITVDGVTYKIDLEEKTASVSASQSYTGSAPITIPGTLNYKDKTFPVESTQDLAFYYNYPDLQGVVIEDGVQQIGELNFADCTGLTYAVIPESVKRIGSSSFSGCPLLDSIVVAWTDPAACICESGVLSDVPTTATIYVPAGTRDLYLSTNPWKKFNIVEIAPTGIHQHTLEADNPISACYNTSGQRITKPQQGQVVIVKYADGSSRKVLVK